MPPRGVLLSICALSLSPSIAIADAPPAGGAQVDPATVAAAAPAPPSDTEDDVSGGPLEWDPSLRRLHPVEYAIGPVLIGGAFAAYTIPDEPGFDFAAGNRFDQAIQDRVSVRSRTYRSVANAIGDVGFYGSMVYRGAEDLFVVGLARRGWPVASHFLAMDTMAFGLVGAVVWGSQVFIGRQRPAPYYCATDPSYVDELGSCNRYGETRSFLSGHFGAAVAGASLTCLYHRRFQIYRRPRAGAGACGTTIALAVLTGVSRLTGDGHWMTDMLGGGALGFVAGWVLPRAMLFGFGQSEGGGSSRASRVIGHVQPFFQERAAGLETRGAF
jgi:membrane-associated phospholipid phosphatase